MKMQRNINNKIRNGGEGNNMKITWSYANHEPRVMRDSKVVHVVILCEKKDTFPG